jgi:hypothetical protein
MTGPAKDRDVAALRAAVACVGLSGVLLGVFLLLAGTKSVLVAVVCIVIGAVVALVGAANRPSARMSRPARILAYWTLVAFLVLEVMIPLSYAAVRRHLAFDWTEGSMRSLSDRTVRVLSRVTEPLHVTTFLVRSSISDLVRDLLEQYRRANPKIIVENVDPVREGDRMLVLAKELNLEDLRDLASVVFRYGDARKDIPLERLMRSEAPGMPPREQSRPQYAFYGEEEFTSAILEVTEKSPKDLYFTTGHNELNLDGELSEVAKELRRNNYGVRKLANVAGGVPDNCAVLLIMDPDPRAKFTDQELGSIALYLRGGGKLFYASSGGPGTGIEPLLGEYGISVGRDLIIVQSSNPVTVEPRVTGYHDIVNNIRQFALRFEAARSVEALPPPPGIMDTRNYRIAYNLLETAKNCWAETDLQGLSEGKLPVFDARTDKRGPMGVAAFYEPSRTPHEAETPEQAPDTRIVAVGSGAFLIGRQISIFTEPPPAGNLLFFYNAVNWLGEKTELISIPPKTFEERTLDFMTVASAGTIFWCVTVLMPGAFLLAGGLIWGVRRWLR